MQRRKAFSIVAGAGMALAAIAPGAQAIPFLTPKVTAEYDHSAQFSRRTYSWDDTVMAVPSYVDPVKAMIDKQLKAKGWTLTPGGGSATVFLLGNTPDGPHLLAYYTDHQTVWAQSWTQQGWGPGWKPTYGEATFDALGTAENHLVIDIFDTSTHRLMFRAVTGEDLSSSEKKNDKRLNKSVKQIFKGFPKK